MVISVDNKLEAALIERARQEGVSAEALALAALQDRFLPGFDRDSRDDWERQLRGLRVDCGVSLSDAAVSSEGIYD